MLQRRKGKVDVVGRTFGVSARVVDVKVLVDVEDQVGGRSVRVSD